VPWLQRVLHVLPAVLTLGGAHVIWWWKLEKARIYRGESGVVPDRTWAWIRSEWYRPEALPWLNLVRLLLILTLPAFLLALGGLAP
jgi:hypothetical protein